LRLESSPFPQGLDEALRARTDEARRQFDAGLDDDLNTAEALAAIFEHIRETNIAMDSGEFRAGNAGGVRDLLARFDSVFDVLRPSLHDEAISEAEIETLIAERAAARKARDFTRADAIRAQLLEKGVILEDTRGGVRWKRK